MDPNINFESPPNEPEEESIEGLRSDLISLSEKGEINYTSKYLQKANREALEKIKIKYERKQLEITIDYIVDQLFTEIANLVLRIGLSRNPDELEKVLHDNKLFKREFKKIISDLALTIPHIRLMSGGLTILIHILKERAAMAKEEPVKMKEPPDIDLDS